MTGLDADVLVLGGGPAGARVVLADKGYSGTSGRPRRAATTCGTSRRTGTDGGEDGAERRGSLQGPEYMKRMRRRCTGRG
ncbi:hypothetical protein [Actinomadura welshii]|uniref:hypothetical protein n=1 Tax=Actinomadura welshii TaxID=3103817 RepID=UPI000412DAAD|nr:hypothetical protein [Actinomadura madurae]